MRRETSKWESGHGAMGIGIDLGGSSVKAVLMTADGEVCVRENRVFDAGSGMEWVETIGCLVGRLEQEAGGKETRVGLSAPGLAARDGRSIAALPGRLQGLEGLDWTEFLGRRTSVPVLNDAHAALLGEAWVGAARGLENVIMLTLGTGVGGAAIVDGHLLRGHTGKAGHLGHIGLDRDGATDICHLPGSLEVVIGNCTIRERSGGRFESTHDLIAAHLVGDQEATRIWLKSVRLLAYAIASFTNILDPEAVVIGGGIARCGEALFGPLAPMVGEIEWPTLGHHVKLLAAELGEYAGAIGSARNGLATD